VWTFGHAVREIERTHHQVVLEETATKGAAWMFGAFALLDLIAFRNARGNVLTIGIALAAFLASLALYAAVQSLFVADRGRRILVVKRRIGVLAYEKVYWARDIDRVFVHSTINGSGLSLRFKSGRSKRLTMSLGLGDNLDDAAAALNEFLYTPHHG
jgi:hypothetical protein